MLRDYQQRTIDQLYAWLLCVRQSDKMD
jgi:hypothetical protein